MNPHLPPQRTRRASLSSIWAALVLALSGCDGARGARPNLLLVTLDTTRTDRLGCYGAAESPTPTLDALAARGVVFEQAYTPAPMTLPAHATMMTGLLPPQHGARVNGVHRLPDDVPTLAERLAAAGYRTGGFVAAFVLDEKFGLARGFEHYDDDLSEAYKQEVPEELSSYRPGDVVTDAALTWLEEGLGGEDASRPFFAWVHLYDAHFPWHPHGADGEDPDAETGTYDGELAFADRQLARLLGFLREHGLEERTVVVALGDHGEGLGDHHEIEHAYLLSEEVLHVPWVMAGPGIQPGHRVPSLVSLEDFPVTALELLGLPGLGAHGRGLLPALRGEEVPSGRSYAETDLPWTAYRWAPQRSLTTERWKYVRTPLPELYDRTTDRSERANLAETRKDVRAELERSLRELEAEVGQRESTVAAVDSEELAQLAALGYAASGATELPEDLEGLADVKTRLPVKDLSARLRRGLAQDEIGPAEHLGIAQQLVAQSPETPSFQAELGAAFLKLGDVERALPALARVVDMAPTDAGAHYAVGDALQQIGRTAEARPHLEMALELDPDMAAAHVGMGNVLRSEGHPDLAAGEYSEALRLRPGYAEAHYNLAMTFVDRNLLDQAREQFALALEHKPGWGLVHSKLAGFAMGAGDMESAVTHYRGALEELPNDPDLRNDLGVALQRLGRPEEARDQYAAALELAPNFFRPYINLGNLAYDHGRDALALERYEQAVRLAPDLPETSTRLAHFLATTPAEDLRDGPRAITLALRAADLSGGKDPRTLDVLASACATAGRFPEAISAGELALQRAREVGDAFLVRGLEERLALYAEERPFLLTREAAAQGEDEGRTE